MPEFTNRDKFIFRLVFFTILSIFYVLLFHATTSGYENLTEEQQTFSMLLLGFFPSAFIIYIYGEVNKVFDKKKKEKPIHNKIFLISSLFWTIVFISLIIFAYKI
jgi:hypothetical protein